MVSWTRALVGLAVVSTICGPTLADGPIAAKETSLAGPGDVKFTVRMQGPYDAEVPLQVVCYFKHKESGDTTLGAAVELDKRLGGVIASLRSRGEFAGDELETLLLTPPEGTIKPKALLLIGLGDEASLSLDRMERVGRVALREAARLGVNRVAFAPLIRDQGDSRLGAGDVAGAVVRGMLLARDTEIRLRKEGLTKAPATGEWVCEAGPKYFDETVSGVRKAMKEADSVIAARPLIPYIRGKE
jgi:Cytosol aminopeptidase family, N-terminal domain